MTTAASMSQAQVSLGTVKGCFVASGSSYNSPSGVHYTLSNSGTRQSRRSLASSLGGIRPAKVVSRNGVKVRAGLASVTETDFEKEVLQSDVPVLVDFWATWCGPCKLVIPAVEGISKDYEGKLKVVKVDVDAAPQLVEKYKVYGLPYMVLFDKGEVIVKQEGAINRAKLEALLASKLPALAA